MLVLTRKVDQGIVIAGNIYIRVLGVERDRLKIGIAAPKEIVILRQELPERDKDNNKNAARKNSPDAENTDSPPTNHTSHPTNNDSQPPPHTPALIHSKPAPAPPYAQYLPASPHYARVSSGQLTAPS